MLAEVGKWFFVNESEIVAELAAIFARPGEASAGVVLGIGDDAAVIDNVVNEPPSYKAT